MKQFGIILLGFSLAMTTRVQVTRVKMTHCSPGLVINNGNKFVQK